MKKVAILGALAASSIALSWSAPGAADNATGTIIGCKGKYYGATIYYLIKNGNFYQQAPEGWRHIKNATVTPTRIYWRVTHSGLNMMKNIDRKTGDLNITDYDTNDRWIDKCSKFIEKDRKF
jgi:hypothetical protein